MQPKLSEGRTCDFIRDWNRGVTRDELSEKYGVRYPAQLAHRLRREGRWLFKRYRGAKNELAEEGNST